MMQCTYFVIVLCPLISTSVNLDREQSLGRKKRLPTTHQEIKYALPIQRKIPIGQNRCACQSNLICSVNYAIISSLNVDFINKHG